MTDRRQEVSGTVTDALRKPAARYYVVVVFPTTPKEGVVPARFITTATPQKDGMFRIANLPPGGYLAAAFERIDQDAQYDPEFREMAAARATPFHLSSGEALDLELSLIE